VLTRATALGLSVSLVLAGCGTVPSKRAADVGSTVAAGPPVTIYVIKRSWHTDIGFDATDLHPPLATLRLALPEAHYLLFGFGDKHYLMTRANSFQGMVGAVWPGEGLARTSVRGQRGCPTAGECGSGTQIGGVRLEYAGDRKRRGHGARARAV
jgi:uncharacterized protein YceK